MYDPDPPLGYVRFAVGEARVVCDDGVAEALRQALHDGTLYEYAARHPAARPLAGRGTSYAVPLPGGDERVVVRRNRHGGLLASLTGELFRPPTRAPLELSVSERLRALGVPTPRVLGYVTYPGPAGLERADVMTREISDSVDLSAALMADDADVRRGALISTAGLLRKLQGAGARHQDLNIKNVLLRARGSGTFDALVLDVDRVTFGGVAQRVLELNLARLLRSARKWQTVHGARVTDAELDELSALVRAPDRRPLMTLS